MSNFYTMYDRPESLPSDPGDPIHIDYQARFDADGVPELVPVGKTYIPDMIQSHAESCDINVLLSRYAHGETDVLSQMQGVYMDAVNMPHSFAELLNTVIDGQRQFESLPLNVRERFGNSFAEWLAAMDNLDDFAAKMGRKPVDPAPASDPVKEVS